MRCEYKLGFKKHYVYVCMRVGGGALGSQERAPELLTIEPSLTILRLFYVLRTTLRGENRPEKVYKFSLITQKWQGKNWIPGILRPKHLPVSSCCSKCHQAKSMS